MVTDLGPALDIIASKAKALRDAGIVGHVKIGDVEFDITQPEPSAPIVTAVENKTKDPLDDEDTYGGSVPQRRRRGEPPPEDES